MRIGWQTAVPDGKATGQMSDLLFDTNCLLDIYHGRERIRSHFESIRDGKIRAYLSVITEAELWRGLRTGEINRHETLINQFALLPLHSETARLAGAWMQQYGQSGLGWMDAFITATAKTTSLTVLTRDKRLAQVLASEA
ncbi:MAG: PIN domain-containing protein, partial [Anaerolineae bacterium]|nr:PIN domain-containing protein [Anaerolineae bacterium]